MSANNTIILQSYKYLDGQTATNLLIFGSKEVNISVDIEDFESRLRKKNPDQITVEIPALDYMQYGPGRYATPDKFNVIKKIMDGAPAPDGIYSYNDLKNYYNIGSRDHLAYISQYYTDLDSYDAAERVYVWLCSTISFLG